MLGERIGSMLAASILVTAIAAAQTQPDITPWLRKTDQALLDAIAPGDSGPWNAVMSPDFTYADENNHVFTRAEYIKEFVPMPKGISGHLAIDTYDAHRQGDTVVVLHRDSETESYFGSELHAQYLMTEVWQRLDGRWMLRSVHCAAVPTDAPTIQLSTDEMDQLTGTYRAGSLTYVIRRDGSRLLGGQPGRSEAELKAETRDVLVVAGQFRNRKVFSRNQAEAVTGFADRRENRDLLWSKVQ